MSGRHRAPSKSLIEQTGPLVAKSALVGIVSATLPLAAVGTAQADVLDDIKQCESSGNPRATNGSHFGHFQFDLATWRSVGGTGNPMNASASEQRKRAEMLLARRGTQPWNASKSCWTKRGSSPQVGSGVTSSAAKPATPQRRASVLGTPTGRGPDGRGVGICTRDLLYFDACDPDNLGQRFQFPKYS